LSHIADKLTLAGQMKDGLAPQRRDRKTLAVFVPRL
jgi:hypothetical protein